MKNKGAIAHFGSSRLAEDLRLSEVTRISQQIEKKLNDRIWMKLQGTSHALVNSELKTYLLTTFKKLLKTL